MKVITLLSVLAALMSCKQQVVDVQLVDRSAHCRSSSEQIFVVDSQSQIDTLLSKRLFLEDENKSTPYDFNENVYVFVSAGQKPSRGYQFEMTGEQALLKGHDLVLPLSLTKPKSGFLQAQVVTFPCAVLSAKRSDVDDYLHADIAFILQGDIEKN